MSDRPAEEEEEDPTSDVGMTGASTFDTARFREVLGHFTSGLTVITGGFVVAGFALAELVLAARPRARSG